MYTPFAVNSTSPNGRIAVRDASGFAVFSGGDIGAAHVMAHRLSDAGQPAVGHALLGRWLEANSGTGSEWVHLQFHMALFELALNHWQHAWRRFTRHVLPAAILTDEALTDAPALLWRLALTAPGPIDLPWNALRATAVRNIDRTTDPFVELHHLLALAGAGAGDVTGLDRWLESRSASVAGTRGSIVADTGIALRDYASGKFREAAARLDQNAPAIATVGGSRAQNELFFLLARAAWRRADIKLAAA